MKKKIKLLGRLTSEFRYFLIKKGKAATCWDEANRESESIEEFINIGRVKRTLA